MKCFLLQYGELRTKFPSMKAPGQLASSVPESLEPVLGGSSMSSGYHNHIALGQEALEREKDPMPFSLGPATCADGS
jgi:hypothetical protein